jgi:hypothetical protein
MRVSYVHDSLRDMASAAVAMCRGAREVTVVFMNEPGEHHVVFRRLEKDLVQIDVYRHEDWTSWGMDKGEPTLVLTGQTKLAHIRGQVLSVLQRILKEEGPDGYKRRWLEHDFPARELAELSQVTSSCG